MLCSHLHETCSEKTKKHVSDKHVWKSIVHIICAFQTRFIPLCIMYAFSRHQCAWNYSPQVFGKYCPKYFAFCSWQITDVEFLYQPIFVLKISFPRSTSLGNILSCLGYFDFPPHHFQPPCLTCLVWSWSKLPQVVSIMIRLNKFRSCFAQCTA